MRAAAIAVTILLASFFASEAQASDLVVWPSPARVAPNADGQIELELVVINDGLLPAHEVLVSDTLAPGATLRSSEPPALVEGDELRWALGTLGPGESARVRLTLEGAGDLGAEVRGVIAAAPTTATAAPLEIEAAQLPEELRDALAPTHDANARDPRVLSVVARRGGDTAALLDYVREEIGFEAYRGSLRGARGTIASGAGNSFDQASLAVALLRAAGVPARYGRTLLDDEVAGELIRSMFDEPNALLAPLPDPDELSEQLADRDAMVELLGPEIASLLPDDPILIREALFPDPTLDGELLAATRDHVFVELFSDGIWTPVDLTGALPLPVATSTFAEVEDADRHLVGLTVTAESYHTLFGVLGTDEQPVFAEVIPAAALAGRPLSLQHDVVTNDFGGLVFNTITHTYIPQLYVEDELFSEGIAFQELLSSFPGGTQIITGVFLDVELFSPDGEVHRARSSVVDRIGPAGRNGYGDVTVEIGDEGNPPALSPLDVLTVLVSPAWTHPLDAAGARTRAHAAGESLASLLPALEALAPDAPLSPYERALVDEASRGGARAQRALTASMAFAYGLSADATTRFLAESHIVSAYPNESRVAFFGARASSAGALTSVSLARDEVFAVAPAGVSRQQVRALTTTRSIFLGKLEGDLVASLTTDPDMDVVSYETVFTAAMEQGIAIRTLAPGEFLELERLPLPPNTKAAIRNALMREQLVIVPEAPVELGGHAHSVWLEYDPWSGRILPVDVAGRFGAAVSYAALDNILTSGEGFVIGVFMGFTKGVLFGLGTALEAVHWKRADEEKRGLSAFSVPTPVKFGVAASLCVASAAAGGGNWEAIVKTLGRTNMVGMGIIGGTPFSTTIRLAMSLLGVELLTLNARGTPAFVLGTKLGLCIGEWAGRQFVAQALQAILVGQDPPLPSSPLVVAKVPHAGFPWVRTRTHETNDGLAKDAPPGELPGALRASGAFALSTTGPLVLDGSLPLRVEGAWTRDGVDLGTGTYDIRATSLHAIGSGSIAGDGSLTAFHDHSSLDLKSGELSLSGDLVLIGQREDDSTAHRYEVSGAVLQGERLTASVTLPDDYEMTLQGGTLAHGAEGWLNATGTLVVEGESRELDFSESDRLTLSGLPSALELERGESVLVTPTVSATSVVEGRLSVRAPAGWSVLPNEEGEGFLIEALPDSEPAPGALLIGFTRDTEIDDGVYASIPISLSTAADEVTITLEHNPLFTTDIAGQPVPLVMMGRVTHRAEGATSYALHATASGALEPRLPMSTVPLVAGEDAVLFFPLHPSDDALPAPGTPITVELTLDDGTRQGVASHTFAMPEVWGAHASFTPLASALEPGQSLDATLTLTPTGNAVGPLTVTTSYSREIAVEGIPPSVTLSDELELPVRLTLEPSARPGLPYAIVVEIHREEALVARTLIILRVAGESESRLLEVATIAKELGLDLQQEQWLAVSRNLDAAITHCSSQRVYSLALSILGLATELRDPAFQEVRTQLRLMVHDWNDALMSCDAFSSEETLELLEEAASILEAIRDYDFRIDVSPRTTTATLGEQVEASIRLERRTTNALNLELEVVGLPATLASPVSPDPVIEAHPLLIHANQPGQHIVLVRARPLEAPALLREARIVISAGAEHVRIAKVGATTRFPVPGASLPLFVDVVNALQLPQSLEARVEVRRPDGSLLYESPEPVPIELPLSEQGHRFDIGRADTFNEAPGVYAVSVTLSSPGGEPVPGGEASDIILIGQPVDLRAGVVPSPLPPGDIDAEVHVALERRPWNVVPGLGNVDEIIRMASDAAGPSDIWVRADGYAFVTNFGTTSWAGDPDYIPSDTLSRIHPDGTVEQFAVIGEAATAVTECPDGMLYTVNAGKPERIMRVDPETGETTIFHEFNALDAAHGENILDLVCADDGTLYASEYYDPFIFGIIWPGKWIYTIHPDLDNDGRSDGVEHLIDGLQRPTSLALDRRTGDLIVHEEDSRRLVRVNTVGTPEIVELVRDIDVSGLHIDEDGILLVLERNGSILVWETVVVDGHTELVGEGLPWLDGLHRSGSIERGPNGDLWTLAFESHSILRVALSAQVPAPPVSLTLAHDTLGAGVNESSAFPDLGVDGPTWSNGTVGWTQELASNEDTLSFGYTHKLLGLEPGDEVQLSRETRATLTSGGEVLELTLPGVRAQVGHLITLEPVRVAAAPGTGVDAQVTLHNLSPIDETYALTLIGLPASVMAELDEEVVVPAGQVKTVTLRLLVDPTTAEDVYTYTLRTETSSGVVDDISAELEVSGPPLEVRIEPAEVEGTFGEVVEVKVIYRRENDDPRRGFNSHLSGLPPGISAQHGLIIDFHNAPLVDGKRQLVHTTRFTLQERQGSYPFGVEVTGLIPHTPGYVTMATGVVRVTDDVGLTVKPIPEEQTVGRGMPVTITARIENHSATTRSVRLTRCCGDAYWGPQYDAGPHVLGPGEVRFVPIRMAPNPILAGLISHRLTVTDVDDPRVKHESLGYVNIATVPAGLQIIGAKDVVASDGEASFTVRIFRPYAGPQIDSTIQLVVDGPLGFAAELPSVVEFPGNYSFINVPLTLSGLTGLAPGPWPVRVTGWRTEEPDIVMSDTGFVTIPSGGLEASFRPTVLHARTGHTAEASVVLQNGDFTLAREGSATLTTSEGLLVTPTESRFSLSPGGQQLLPVRVLAEESGSYTLDVLVSSDDGEFAAAQLEVLVVDNQPPSAPLAVAPLTGSTTGTLPNLVIEAASDPDGDTLTYLYELLDDAGAPVGSWLSAELQLPIGPLPPGAHRWRARATDGYELGPWSEEQRFLVDLTLDHSPPGVPEIVAPSDGEELDTWPLVLEWLPAIDPDGDALVYDVQLAENEDFDALRVDEVDIVANDEGRLLLEVNDLPGGTVYFARVRARDAFHAGPWASVSFSLENRAPPIPELLSPIDGATVPVGEVELRFTTVEDPDGHRVRYRVQVFADPDAEEPMFLFEDVSALEDEEELSVSFDGGQEAARYFWTAEAIDELGLSSGEAIREELNLEQATDNRPPPAPVLLHPAEGDEVRRGTVELVLGNVDDPDGDALRYELKVSNENGVVHHSPAIPAEEGNETKLELELTAVGEHSWSARSIDARGLESEWVTATFVVTTGTVDGGASGGGKKVPGDDGSGASAPDSCGCRSTGDAPEASAWLAAGVLLLQLFRRRRCSSHQRS